MQVEPAPADRDEFARRGRAGDDKIPDLADRPPGGVEDEALAGSSQRCGSTSLAPVTTPSVEPSIGRQLWVGEPRCEEDDDQGGRDDGSRRHLRIGHRWSPRRQRNREIESRISHRRGQARTGSSPAHPGLSVPPDTELVRALVGDGECQPAGIHTPDVTGRARWQQAEASGTHSITSSACASKVGGTVRPSAFAVLEVDQELKLVGLLHRQILRIGALEDPIETHSDAGTAVQIDNVAAVGKQAALGRELGIVGDRRQAIARRQFDDHGAPLHREHDPATGTDRLPARCPRQRSRVRCRHRPEPDATGYVPRRRMRTRRPRSDR